MVFLLFLSFFFQLDEAIILFISFSKKDHRFLYACLDARKDDKNMKKATKNEWISMEQEAIGKQCLLTQKRDIEWTTKMVAFLHKQGLRLNEIAFCFSGTEWAKKNWDLFLKTNKLPEMNPTLDAREAWIWTDDNYDTFDSIMLCEDSLTPLPPMNRAYRVQTVWNYR